MKAIIITGISQGLGKAIFDLLTPNDELLLVGISRNFSEAQKQLEQQRKQVYLMNLDLSDLTKIGEVVSLKAVFEEHGVEEIIFINNAGVIWPVGPIGTLKQEEVINAMNINATAPMLLANIFAAMERKLTVVNVSSGAANRALEGWSVYCASKAAAKMFFEEMKFQNPRVVIHQFDPGVMDTQMQTQIRGVEAHQFPQLQDFIALKENKQLQSPEEVATSLIAQLKL